MEEDYSKYDLYKENPTDRVFWVDVIDRIGEYVFTLDGRKFYNLFEDYPHNMTEEEVRIFSEENTYWREFFDGRFCLDRIDDTVQELAIILFSRY